MEREQPEAAPVDLDVQGVDRLVARQGPVDPAWRPFCSERCKIEDLARWVEGVYRVPGDAAPDDADDDDGATLETEN